MPFAGQRATALTLLLALSAQPASAAGTGVFRRTISAGDGVALALHRYVPAGGGTTRPPVLLLPDLGLDRSAYDFEGRGLARELRRQGLDTFVLEPRGHGASGRPANAELEDVVSRDLVAAVDAISAARGGEGMVDLVVHGFSGGLALGAVPRELVGRIRRVVAISPAVALDPPTPPVQLFFEAGATPSRLGLTPDGANLFELLYTRNGRFQRGQPRRLLRAFDARLDANSLSQWRRWHETGAFRFSDGSSLTSRLASFDRPALLVLATGDNLVHPDFGSPLRELAPRAQVQVRVLSKRELLREDGSHLSVLHGRDARQDVHLPIVRFLKAADPDNPPPARLDGTPPGEVGQ